MAKVPINDPKHWRERAEEARTLADELTDPDSKRKMLRIADDHEKIDETRREAIARRGQNVICLSLAASHLVAKPRLGATGTGFLRSVRGRSPPSRNS